MLLKSTQNVTDFHLSDYILLFTTEPWTRGLMIYVHNLFSAKTLNSNENIHGCDRRCIELSHKSRN